MLSLKFTRQLNSHKYQGTKQSLQFSHLSKLTLKFVFQKGINVADTANNTP